MSLLGLSLLALALVLMMTTGWATYAVLLAVSTFGAVLGVALGAFDSTVLRSLPDRVVGLLEHDLLQALVLYALVGALLNHLALVNGLYGGLRKCIARVTGRQAAPALAGLGVGMLMAPMNGSVGASLITLSRTAGQAWKADGMAPARRTALVAVTSTLGIIVPPSLVLLLLGDAMLRAHTEGLTLARQLGLPAAQAGTRIINTQDVVQAVLVPGAMLLLLWLGVSWWFAARQPDPAAPPAGQAAQPVGALSRSERWTVLVVPTLIIVLLGLVVTGHARAVEAAATAGLVLMGWGFASRQLTRTVLMRVLDDTMAMTGALFALLVAAVTFSLLLRAFGTDVLVAEWMRALQGQPVLAMLVVLTVLLGAAFVLDAFELIFLVIPIVMPPLLAVVGDAAWVAALTLLVLQAGFLLPPLGYALVLARAQEQPRPALGAVTQALAPYLVCLLAVFALVIAVPQTTHWLRTAPETLPDTTMDSDDLDALMRDMSQPATPDDTPPPPPPPRD
jgi:tripartite ATP-independent transporter DctM subunit